MAAPIGNKFWLKRATHGAPRIFEDPEALRDSCLEYFEYTDSTPLFEDKTHSYEGVVLHEPVAKMRPFTINGLCIFLGITHDTWIDWRKGRKDLCEVIKWAEQIIREQKFAGAAAGLLNANIISRDLGLIDSSAVKQTVEGEMNYTSSDNLQAQILKALPEDQLKAILDGFKAS